MAPPKGTPKPPGSGRKRGTPNKLKAPSVKAKIAEAQAEALARVEETIAKQTPLEFALECMRDPSNPPGFRLEACKVAMPYIHAKMAEAPSDKVAQITEIRRIIVRPRETEIDEHGVERFIDEGEYSNGEPLEPAATDPAEYKAAAERARVRRDALATPATAPEPDPVAIARSRLDRMRGVN
jgi:hypothetical protein